MAKKTKTLRAGTGAKCSICTRFLHPKIEGTDHNHRSNVVLVSTETRKLNRKLKECYTCVVDGIDDTIYYAAKSNFRLEKEGSADQYFVPLTEAEKEQERQDKTSRDFQEPKKKWEKSEARKRLYLLILDGVIADEDNDAEDLQEIYMMDEEFLKYDYGKFKDRLSRLRTKIHQLNDRAKDDLEAFENYKSNHKPSLFSHKGYIQWQGSDAQELLLDDIAKNMHKTMKPEELWLSRNEYKNEFPLHAFRDKLRQEIKTAKYLYTLKERGLSKKKK
jgi:hypothetical protein